VQSFYSVEFGVLTSWARSPWSGQGQPNSFDRNPYQLGSSCYPCQRVYHCKEKKKKFFRNFFMLDKKRLLLLLLRRHSYLSVPSLMISSSASSEYISIGELYCLQAMPGLPTVVKLRTTKDKYFIIKHLLPPTGKNRCIRL